VRRAPLLLLSATAVAVALASLLRPLQPFVPEPPLRLTLPSEAGQLDLERLGPLPGRTGGLVKNGPGPQTVVGWRYRVRGGTGAETEPVILWLKLATSSARSNRSYLVPAPVNEQDDNSLQGCLALDGNGLDPSGMLRAQPLHPSQRLLWLLGLRPYNQQACWTLKP
jgi:hypothetical protein